MTSRGRVGWVGLVVVVFVAGWASFVWTELRPAEIASDWHGWRQTDTQTIALNFTKPGASIVRPQISWGGDGPGYVETEFQLYPKLVSLLMRVVGRVEWIGQFISLLAIVATAGMVFVHLSQRYHPLAAALGFGAFLAARNSPSLASLIMPDALALLFYVTAWAYFWQYAKHGRTRDLVVFGLVGTLAMLTKPTTAHIGISSFVFLALSDRSRFRDYRIWTTWIAMVAVVSLYLAQAHHLYAEYGNTFGLLVGEDSKVPHLRYLLIPSVYVKAARFGVPWGLGSFAAAVLVIQALRRRLDAEQFALAVGNIIVVLIALRYMSDVAGVHYYAPASLLAASAVANLSNDLLEAKLRYISLTMVCVFVLFQGYRSIQIRYASAHFTRDDPKVAPIVETGRQIDRLTDPGDLIVVRSPNDAYDTFWQQAANYHDPRIFYISGTRGWTLGREQADVPLLTEAMHKGARFFADPISDHLTLLDSWLSAHAKLVWSGESGERIWGLQ